MRAAGPYYGVTQLREEGTRWREEGTRGDWRREDWRRVKRRVERMVERRVKRRVERMVERMVERRVERMGWARVVVAVIYRFLFYTDRVLTAA